MAARKKRAIVASVKHEIIAKIECGERQSSICRELSLSKTTVNSIWRNRKKLKQSLESAGFSIDCKRLRTSNHSDVDAVLLVWFKQARSTNIPVSGPLLLEKATVLARALGNKSFTATAGFIDHWKKRHCIIMKKVSGEAGSVVDEDTRPWLNEILPQLLSQYKPEDVYNADETGLFYKLKPDKSLCFKNEKCTGAKLQPCDQGIIQSLKVHYRHQLLKKVVQSMDSGVELKITVLDAMQWLKFAWDKVTPETIKNCFHHCNFNLGTPKDRGTCIGAEAAQADLNHLLNDLRQKGMAVEGQVEDFLNLDNDVETAGILSDNEIAVMCHSEIDTCTTEEEQGEGWSFVGASVSEHANSYLSHQTLPSSSNEEGLLTSALYDCHKDVVQLSGQHTGLVAVPKSSPVESVMPSESICSQPLRSQRQQKLMEVRELFLSAFENSLPPAVQSGGLFGALLSKIWTH
eukprot:Em0001g1316a